MEDVVHVEGFSARFEVKTMVARAQTIELLPGSVESSKRFPRMRQVSRPQIADWRHKLQLHQLAKLIQLVHRLLGKRHLIHGLGVAAGWVQPVVFGNDNRYPQSLLLSKTTNRARSVGASDALAVSHELFEFMKTLPLFLCAAAAFTFGSAERSRAEEMNPAAKSTSPAPPAAGVMKPVSRAAEILQRFDKNRDGRLDDDERADAHDVMLQEQMAKEAPPASAQGLGYFPELALELFDRNHDGQLDEGERAAAMAFLERGDPDATRETLLRRFDQNRDGKLDDPERREAAAYAVEHRGELLREVLLRRYDANANGQLEPEEKTAVRAAFMSTPLLPELESAASRGSAAGPAAAPSRVEPARKS